MEKDEIIYMETTHDHPVVGKYFRAWDGKSYFCDSYDPRIGYWMTEVDNAENRKNVSERAIGRTYHFDWRRNS